MTIHKNTGAPSELNNASSHNEASAKDPETQGHLQSLKKQLANFSRGAAVAISALAATVPAQATDTTTSETIQATNTMSASDFINSLPPTSDPIEQESREFLVFLGEEEPLFAQSFIEVYGGALQKSIKDETLAKRYVSLAIQDFILDEKQYFSASLLTPDQIGGLEEKLGAGSDQNKSEIYGRFIDKNTDKTTIENIKRLNEEINELDEEINELDEESKRLDEEGKRLDEELKEGRITLEEFKRIKNQLGIK